MGRNNKYRFSRLLLWGFLSMLLFSCAGNVSERKDFPPAERLTAEKIPLHEIFRAGELTTKGNKLIISSYRTDTLLYFYSLPDLKLQASGAISGGGPGEYPQEHLVFCSSPSDTLLVWDIMLNLRKVYIDSTGDVHSENAFNLGRIELFNNIHICRDSIMVYFDTDNLEIKKRNLSDNALLGSIKFEKENHRDFFLYSNRGAVMANDSAIVYTYFFKDRIDIFDLETLKLKKSILGPGEPEIISGDLKNSKAFTVNTHAGKKYFYTTYEKSKDRKEFVLRVHNYNGNPVAEYSFDIFPHQYTIDEENGYIYGYNSNFENYFLRYKINLP